MTKTFLLMQRLSNSHCQSKNIAMKKLLFFSLTLFLSCSKVPGKAIEKDLRLTGKWILIETLSDPGDGSGKWVKVEKPNCYFAKFNPDSSAETNIPGRFGNLIKYYSNNDSTVSFIYSKEDTTALHYKINDAYLTITGGCIEACGSKFKAGL